MKAFMARPVGLPQAALYLLQEGADPDEPDDEGGTPLHFAASRDHAGVVALLLEWGADPSRVTGASRTPLMTAAAESHLGAVEALLASAVGALTVNAVTDTGDSALWLACREGAADVARRVLQAGGDPTVGACRGFGHRDCVDLLQVSPRQEPSRVRFMSLAVFRRCPTCVVTGRAGSKRISFRGLDKWWMRGLNWPICRRARGAARPRPGYGGG
jgi:hypothetical protein